MTVPRSLIRNETEDRKGRDDEYRNIKGAETPIRGPAWTAGPQTRGDCVHPRFTWHSFAEHESNGFAR